MLIQLHNVCKLYPSVAALRDVSLHINEGEFVALVGPSGSGKSTLLNLLGLLDTPTAGAYHFAGHDVNQLNSPQRAQVRNRHIGFVFQGFHLLPRLTARENVELPMIYAGVSARERRSRAMQLLERVGLADRTTHRPNELSGGQQQRVAIARALAMKPALILADEPTGNLDSTTGAEMLAAFGELHRDDGITLILVTHAHEIADRAQRIVTVRDGLIVEDTKRRMAA